MSALHRFIALVVVRAQALLLAPILVLPLTLTLFAPHALAAPVVTAPTVTTPTVASPEVATPRAPTVPPPNAPQASGVPAPTSINGPAAPAAVSGPAAPSAPRAPKVEHPAQPQKPSSAKAHAPRRKGGKAAAAATGTAAATAPPPPTNEQNTRPAPATPAEEAVQAYTAGDYATAHRIWEKQAAAGDGLAMNNLGVLYDQGQGVEPDMGRALHWFAQSAKTGTPAGMSNYGRMLEQGRGIPANPEEASRWFDLAARKGQPVAQYNLGMLYELGRGVTKDIKAAAAWYSRAAAQQQTEALSRLGFFYRTGLGVAKNRSRATLLLYAAAMQGEPGAMRALEEMAAEEGSRPPAVLFGLRLDATDRPTVRNALQRAGAAPKREDDAHICDIYAAERVAPGAFQLAVCYGPGDPAPLGFLELDYTAPNRKTAGQIVGMVSQRMGPPSASEGDDAHLWNLGAVVVATRYEPTRRLMSLMYMVPKVYHLTRQD